jgi:hypothetical protein
MVLLRLGGADPREDCLDAIMGGGTVLLGGRISSPSIGGDFSSSPVTLSRRRNNPTGLSILSIFFLVLDLVLKVFTFFPQDEADRPGLL